MSLIDTEVVPFKLSAYKDGKFITVSNEDLKGKWSVFVFFPAAFTFVCDAATGGGRWSTRVSTRSTTVVRSMSSGGRGRSTVMP